MRGLIKMNKIVRRLFLLVAGPEASEKRLN